MLQLRSRLFFHIGVVSCGFFLCRGLWQGNKYGLGGYGVEADKQRKPALMTGLSLFEYPFAS
jgi:hypothetical protein